jgi:nucleotide sugar dehydrogenase
MKGFMRLGIVGFGAVGRHLDSLFNTSDFEVVIYDKYLEEYSGAEIQARINTCQFAFVAVPTPCDREGRLDLRFLLDALRWLTVPVCLKSTVLPGTTERLSEEFGVEITFCPEYYGETSFHKTRLSSAPDLIVLGGNSASAQRIMDAYKRVVGPNARYFKTDSRIAELAKYMENCFFATKLAFLADFHELSAHYNVDFDAVREIWVSDDRIGLSHSIIVDQPGFGGKCLPKDLTALLEDTSECRTPVLRAVRDLNEDLRGITYRDEIFP